MSKLIRRDFYDFIAPQSVMDMWSIDYNNNSISYPTDSIDDSPSLESLMSDGQFVYSISYNSSDGKRIWYYLSFSQPKITTGPILFGKCFLDGGIKKVKIYPNLFGNHKQHQLSTPLYSQNVIRDINDASSKTFNQRAGKTKPSLKVSVLIEGKPKSSDFGGLVKDISQRAVQKNYNTGKYSLDSSSTGYGQLGYESNTDSTSGQFDCFQSQNITIFDNTQVGIFTEKNLDSIPDGKSAVYGAGVFNDGYGFVGNEITYKTAELTPGINPIAFSDNKLQYLKHRQEFSSHYPLYSTSDCFIIDGSLILNKIVETSSGGDAYIDYYWIKIMDIVAYRGLPPNSYYKLKIEDLHYTQNHNLIGKLVAWQGGKGRLYSSDFSKEQAEEEYFFPTQYSHIDSPCIIEGYYGEYYRRDEYQAAQSLLSTLQSIGISASPYTLEMSGGYFGGMGDFNFMGNSYSCDIGTVYSSAISASYESGVENGWAINQDFFKDFYPLNKGPTTLQINSHHYMGFPTKAVAYGEISSKFYSGFGIPSGGGTPSYRNLNSWVYLIDYNKTTKTGYAKLLGNVAPIRLIYQDDPSGTAKTTYECWKVNLSPFISQLPRGWIGGKVFIVIQGETDKAQTIPTQNWVYFRDALIGQCDFGNAGTLPPPFTTEETIGYCQDLSGASYLTSFTSPTSGYETSTISILSTESSPISGNEFYSAFTNKINIRFTSPDSIKSDNESSCFGEKYFYGVIVTKNNGYYSNCVSLNNPTVNRWYKQPYVDTNFSYFIDSGITKLGSLSNQFQDRTLYLTPPIVGEDITIKLIGMTSYIPLHMPFAGQLFRNEGIKVHQATLCEYKLTPNTITDDGGVIKPTGEFTLVRK